MQSRQQPAAKHQLKRRHSYQQLARKSSCPPHRRVGQQLLSFQRSGQHEDGTQNHIEIALPKHLNNTGGGSYHLPPPPAFVHYRRAEESRHRQHSPAEMLSPTTTAVP